MRIAILRASYEGSTSPTAALARPFDPTLYMTPGAHEVIVVDLVGIDVMDQLRALDATFSPDVYLNLCQGGFGDGRSGPYVPAALEKLGRPFTGASDVFYNLHKVETKRRMTEAGVDTPASVHARTEADIAHAAANLPFPLFVKHHDGSNSISVFEDNLVTDVASLERVARRVLAAHGGALIEAYVDGPEVAVLLAENAEDPANPFVYAPLEIGFPGGARFFHFDLKWGSYASFVWRPIEDATLDARLREAARRAWVACEGRSYARCDFRVDSAGTPWLLEINPNCCVFYPPDDLDLADNMLVRAPGGHALFLERILAAALR